MDFSPISQASFSTALRLIYYVSTEYSVASHGSSIPFPPLAPLSPVPSILWPCRRQFCTPCQWLSGITSSDPGASASMTAALPSRSRASRPAPRFVRSGWACRFWHTVQRMLQSSLEESRGPQWPTVRDQAPLACSSRIPRHFMMGATTRSTAAGATPVAFLVRSLAHPG